MNKNRSFWDAIQREREKIRGGKQKMNLKLKRNWCEEDKFKT